MSPSKGKPRKARKSKPGKKRTEVKPLEGFIPAPAEPRPEGPPPAAEVRPAEPAEAIPIEKEVAPEAGPPIKSSNIALMERSRPLEAGKAWEELKLIESIKPPTETDFSFTGSDVPVNEALLFLLALKESIEEKRVIGIYFHNDMDGLNGALLVNWMARGWFGDKVEVHASPLEYNELARLSLHDDITYVFVDMDMGLSRENVFRIDHHDESRGNFKITDRLFLISPPVNDYEYPSSATALCAYLYHLSKGARSSFFEYLNSGPWHKEAFVRTLMLLASVCDNLWTLNMIIDIPIKRWIPDPEEERNLILMSISASLTLGSEERRAEVVERFFKDRLDLDTYIGTICQQLIGARNVLEFTDAVSTEAGNFYNRIVFNISDSMDKSMMALQRDRDLLAKLEQSMPLEMRNNREKMMELLKTRGNTNDRNWKRVEFYGKEMVNLEAKISVEEKRLSILRRARQAISPPPPKLCVYIPKQISRQVKGIIASLLYYKGWKNIIIEERGSESFWGSRGFTSDTINEHFSTLSMGLDELKDYLLVEKAFKDLPQVLKRTVNISKNISFLKAPSGGMGGRGLIYGGVLKGKVPWVFSLLEETGDLEEKVKELMLHKELGNAIQGLTEGQSNVPTGQALRAKFKSTGWLVVTLLPGKEGADILLGNFNMGVLSIVGYTERFSLNLVKQPPPVVPMDHQQFDIAP